MNYAELDRSLGFQLARAGVPANRAFESLVGSKLKLRRAEYSVLVILRANEKVTAKDLAIALSISPPNMSVVLDRLWARGIIRRVQDPKDRRAQYIELERLGVTLIEEAVNICCEMERNMMRKLSEDEREQLLLLLRKVYAANPLR